MWAIIFVVLCLTTVLLVWYVIWSINQCNKQLLELADYISNLTLVRDHKHTTPNKKYLEELPAIKSANDYDLF